ncbi:PQ-loop repeat family protein [Musa troglodytarum]|uniref:PQ-loop repeat family protein n=1 Tax=Musa troglodytarum TaxID=320322 RepID=A0A9E7FGP3_9LILI|nr:PQ-loop repeat family protein [Musa troglodytarum]
MAKSLAWASCGEEERACVGWIERYFNDCVCSVRGELSFGLGMISLFCWGIAEVPQIITNFHNKSGHGVSLAFLLTWVVGDIFNLVGCLLEPVTLPTQFYTALLYAAVTVVLVLQILYYDYWLRCCKSIGFAAQLEVEEDSCKHLNPNSEDHSHPVPALTASRTASPRADVCYTSARSLASSATPPYISSYLGPARSGPSASGYMESSGSDDERSPRHRSWRSGMSNPSRILCRSVGYGTFAAASVTLPFQTKASMEVNNIGLTVGRIMECRFPRSIKLMLLLSVALQEGGIKSLEENPYGLLLGWVMAAIYMGGRLPQIYMNIKRIKSSYVHVCTHCQCNLCWKVSLSLSLFLSSSASPRQPLKEVFLLTIVFGCSILVRSIEWERIKANSPWLLDAIVCVLLDLFFLDHIFYQIIIQFVYYKFMHRRMTSNEDEHEDFMEVKETVL